MKYRLNNGSYQLIQNLGIPWTNTYCFPGDDDDDDDADDLGEMIEDVDVEIEAASPDHYLQEARLIQNNLINEHF